MKTSFVNQRAREGYVALIATILLSLILLALTVNMSAAGFFVRFNALDAEYKRISLSLAESCIHAALLKLAADHDYAPPSGGETVAVGEESCTIVSVTGVDEEKIVKTRASFRGAFSTMEVGTVVRDPFIVPIIPAYLFVTVQVTNDNGGTFQAGDFTVEVSAVNPSVSSFPGAETGTLVTVEPGAYSVSMSGPAGYTKHYSGECSGTIAAGETKNCVITANDVPTTATLTVIANVINDNSGTLGPNDFSLFVDGSPVANGISVTLDPGSHTVSGSGNAGYDASQWGHHCGATGSITLAAGESKTCMITYNDAAPPSPACADTFLMLDRTGSMSATDLANERTAAKAFLDLYAAVTPTPLVGIGLFGRTMTGATGAEIAPATFSTGWRSPGSQGADSGGDGNGFEIDPVHAFADNGGFAENRDGESDRHQFSQYGFSLPSNAVITGIEVRLDWWLDSTSGSNSLGAELSWDGGVTWTSPRSQQTETLADTNNKILGGTTNTWGRSWTVNELADANFRVRVTARCDSSVTCPSRDFFLDWVPVQITYRMPVGFLTDTYGDDDPGDDVDGDLYDAVEEATASNVGATNIALAITIGANELTSPRASGREKVLILISDGEHNTPNTSPEGPLDAADAAKQAGVKIFTIYFGDIPDMSGFMGQEILAAIASGEVSTPAHSGHSGPAHEPGSADDKATPEEENTDGDYFFIAPTSADMPEIFRTIGILVCPAAEDPSPPPPPTTGTINVITEVINDNGGTAVPSSFTMQVSAINPSQTSFVGAAFPGVAVTVEPGAYSVDEGATGQYTKSVGAGCSGTISAGETRVCTITNDDIPPTSPLPPLPPQPPNITIESWVEEP